MVVGGAIALWVILMVFACALCVSAAGGDRTEETDAPSSPERLEKALVATSFQPKSAS